MGWFIIVLTTLNCCSILFILFWGCYNKVAGHPSDYPTSTSSTHLASEQLGERLKMMLALLFFSWLKYSTKLYQTYPSMCPRIGSWKLLQEKPIILMLRNSQGLRSPFSPHQATVTIKIWVA